MHPWCRWHLRYYTGHGKIDWKLFYLSSSLNPLSLSKVKTNAKWQLQTASNYLPNQALVFGTSESLHLWFCDKTHYFCLPLYSISVFNAGSCFSLCLKNACVALSPLLDSHLLSIWSFPQIISSICIFHLLILSSFTICFIFWWLLYRRLVSFFLVLNYNPFYFYHFYV